MNDEFWGEEEKKTPIQKLKDLYDADPYHSGLTQKELNQLRRAGLIESLKEDVGTTREDIRSAIFNVHGVMGDRYTSVLENLVDRTVSNLEEGETDFSNAILSAIDEGLIYTDDQWAVIEALISPSDIGVEGIQSRIDEELFGDIYSVINYLYKDYNDFNENYKSKLTESPVYGLNTQFDKRKSFYNKAHVDVANDGSQTLYSYNVPVCKIQNGEVTLLPDWKYSMTTVRHVKEFLKQNGFAAETSQQIARDYRIAQ